ncbi:MAG TPA: hypothetical protein DDY68_03545 [Porphyromonadaceae bacterium]|nr:hypothetical protein [Porphyromonadaceae bacterium]
MYSRSKRIIFLFLFLCGLNISASSKEVAQTKEWDEVIHEIAEDFQDDEEEGSAENLYTYLSEIASNPLELNQVGKETLSKLIFLTNEQIEEIITYRERQNGFFSVWELRSLRSMDDRTISYLIPFLKVSTPYSNKKKDSSYHWWKHGKHYIQLRFDATLEQKQGYKSLSNEEKEKKPNSFYSGEPFYNHIKYSYSAGEHLQMGLLMEKDAGEPLFKNTKRGYDFYSFHFLLRDIHCLKVLAIGHYRISFGQGLILNNNFSFGKSSLAFTGYKRSVGINRHFSTSENNFLQGIASTIRCTKSIDFTLFYSYKELTANTTDSTITSIKTDGLHRTASEEAKYNQASMQAVGTNLTWKNDWFKFGITYLFYQFSKPYMPTLQNYNALDFRGKENYNLGVHYEYRRQKLLLFGETSFSKSGGCATLNGLHFSPLQTLNVSILQRYYSPTYHAYFSNAFGESSHTRDESGIYLSLNWSFARQWSLITYADFYRFQTAHYGIDAPSSGYDYQIALNYIALEGLDLSLRYRHKLRPKNYLFVGEHRNSIVDTQRDRLKFKGSYQLNAHWLLKTCAEVNFYNRGVSEVSVKSGFMLSQQVEFTPTSKRFLLDFFLGYFHATDYDVRVWSNEKSMLYDFYIPSFYGEGMRITYNLKYLFKKHLSLYLKFAGVYYFDRDFIGTDLERIDKSHKHDIQLMLRWTL